MNSERIVPDEPYQEFVSELFHENTKQRRSDGRFIERILAATFDPATQRMVEPARKAYAASERIALPVALPKAKRSFDDAVLTRRSVRDFTGEPVRLGEMAKLLHFANGVTGAIDAGDGLRQPVRAAPSGGALYPVEIYLLAVRVLGLRSGIYHFSPLGNCLESITRRNAVQRLIRMTYMPELGKAAAIVVLTGIALRNRVKYGERGYRFMLMEAGHVAQNLLLTANALRLSAFAIGGFIDDELDSLLEVDGIDESSLYVIAIGHGGRTVSRR